MAAQDIGVAYVHVEPSGKGFGKSIEGDIGDAVNKASKKSSSTLISKIGGAFGKIGKVGTGAIATLAGGITALAAKGGFTRALNIENAQAKLKGLGHDSASVTEIMNDALASVKGTAFGLGDAATVAASLSASGIKEGDQLTKVLKTVADTAQISGRSLTDIGTIFGSVAARGKLQGDDMLQLMSSGIPVLQMLGKHLNKTSAEVSDMVSDGKIDFQTFADAMQEGLGGAALSAGTTFTGALANVKAALSRLGETAATPVLDGLRGLFNQAIPLIDTFTAAVTPTLQKSERHSNKVSRTRYPPHRRNSKPWRHDLQHPRLPDARLGDGQLQKPTHWPLERNHITHRRTQQWRRSLQYSPQPPARSREWSLRSRRRCRTRRDGRRRSLTRSSRRARCSRSLKA